MRCPFCGELDTRVIDSRLVGEGDQIRRRRQCSACKERFTTYEIAELNYPRIIKSDGSREPFNEDKLRAGIMRALEKRPVDIDKIERAVSKIKHRFRTVGDREIKTRKIGEWVMEQLRALDQVAYVRFASVYHSFEDVRAFLDEIEKLEAQLPPEIKESQLELLPEDKKNKV